MIDASDGNQPTNNPEEEKGSKNSTASADQNIVYNLIMKKTHSQSHSNKRSSDQADKLSSLSDLRNNSLNEGRSPSHKAKTEKSLSDNT